VSDTTLVIPGITDPGTLACIARSRTYVQYCNMVEKALKGECPFCKLGPENVVTLGNLDWQAWQNPFPEKHTKHHFIIAPRRHVTDTEALTITEWCGLKNMMTSLRGIFNYTSRGILIRDGDATLSAGTIQHLHVHVMVPDGTGRVESPFYKGAEEEKQGVLRAIVYEKMRRADHLTHFSEHEKELVKGRV
jgi:ATP adenylyltransferase